MKTENLPILFSRHFKGVSEVTGAASPFERQVPRPELFQWPVKAPGSKGHFHRRLPCSTRAIGTLGNERAIHFEE